MYPMATQIIIPCTRPLCQYRMQVDDKCSSWSLQTHIHPSEYCSKTGNLLKRQHNATLISNFVVWRTSHCLSLSLSLCCIAKGSHSKSRYADSPCCCKHRYTIQADIVHASNMPRLVVHDVIAQLCRVDLTICLYSWEGIQILHAV